MEAILEDNQIGRCITFSRVKLESALRKMHVNHSYKVMLEAKALYYLLVFHLAAHFCCYP